MPTINLTLPVSGTGITAGLHATNYAAIQALLNGGLDAANLDDMGATAGQALIWSGSSWAPGTISPTSYRKTTAKTVNTTTAATDLLNGEITLGAGVLSTNKIARLSAWGDWKQNSGGAAAPPRFQVLLGGTTLLDTGTAGTCANAATRYGWKIVVEIMNLGATNVQLLNMQVDLSASVTASGETVFTTGEGVFQLFTGSALGFAKAEGYNAGAKDSTAALALVLNVINGSANANYETKLFGALVEIL